MVENEGIKGERRGKKRNEEKDKGIWIRMRMQKREEEGMVKRG